MWTPRSREFPIGRVGVLLMGDAFRVLGGQEPHQSSIGGGDGARREVVVDHVVRQLCDSDMRPKRTRPGAHDLLYRLVTSLREFLGAKQAEDDPFLIDHNTGLPAFVRDPFSDVPHAFFRCACRYVATSYVAGTGDGRVRALGRKISGEPIELAIGVVVDLRETKALEPPRGSWT